MGASIYWVIQSEDYYKKSLLRRYRFSYLRFLFFVNKQLQARFSRLQADLMTCFIMGFWSLLVGALFFAAFWSGVGFCWLCFALKGHSNGRETAASFESAENGHELSHSQDNHQKDCD